MNLSKIAASILLVLLVLPLFQAKSYADPKPDIRLAAAPAQRAIAVSNEAPLLSAPRTATISEGVLTSIEATGIDSDPEDSLAISVTGLPPGLKAIVGVGADGKKVAAAFGIVESVGQPFTVTWTVTDGNHAPVSSQTTVSVSTLDNSRIVDRVTTLVHGNYPHGISRTDARELGVAALPILARMLRDEKEESCWPNIAVAIGAIGDTAYFDTLRSFIWNRFSGEVDNDTRYACEIAQANLGTMANLSPRVAAYILTCVDPVTWTGLPWYTQRYQGERLRVQMSQFAIVALSHFDDPQATTKISQLVANPYSPGQAYAIRDAVEASAAVRRVGLIEYFRRAERGGQ